MKLSKIGVKYRSIYSKFKKYDLFVLQKLMNIKKNFLISSYMCLCGIQMKQPLFMSMFIHNGMQRDCQLLLNSITRRQHTR